MQPSIDIISKYFPNLSNEQETQLKALYALYADWNNKINVISRKDIDNLYERHILHSLSIIKVFGFVPGTSFLDIGTGGGFPGIPLAILLPQCTFHLVDSIGKKIKVASEISTAIGLKNTTFQHIRAEQVTSKHDYVVSRAVMPLPELVKIAKPRISKTIINAYPNGIICLKGGNLDAEIAPYKKYAEVTPIDTLFCEEFFATKRIIYIPL